MNQNKSTALALSRILKEHSDETHPLRQEDMINYLKNEYDITVDRKAVSRNLRKIQETGLSLEQMNPDSPDYKPGVYLVDEGLGEAEWRMVLNALSAATFLSERKTKEMSEAIGQYVNEYTRERFEREQRIPNPAKTTNDKALYAINELENAIQQSRPVRFQYVLYVWKKAVVYLHNDASLRCFIPLALRWSGDHYYAVGYLDPRDPQYRHEGKDKLVSFRIDKMIHMTVESQTVPAQKVDFTRYATTSLNGYTGQPELIVLRLTENGVARALDRFGSNPNAHLTRTKDPAYPYEFSTETGLSPVLYGWLAQTGKDARLIGGKNALHGFTAHLQSLNELYR